MSSGISNKDKLFWAALAVGLVLLAVGAWATSTRLTGTGAAPLPVISPVADFALTNQDGRAVSLADLRGHVWLADIVFTRCAGPCPRMTRRMKEIQQALPSGSDARLITLTTDPTYDTPAILKAYAEKFGADPARWQFFTGPKKEIAALGRDSLKLTAIEKDAAERQNPEDLFIHSTIFVLVDKQARLRGFFETEGDDIDPARVRSRILAGIRRLENE